MIWRGLFILACLLAKPGFAGDFTHDRIIGFSENGAYFAFKTYGLQRGSGLPYATVFVVDLMQNAWVSGSPFRAGRDESAMAEVEAAPFAALERVRHEALDNAATMLQDLGIRRPATVLYSAGIGQAHMAQEVTRIAIPNPDNPTAPPMREFALRLSGIPVPAAVDYCLRPDALRGYRLELVRPGGGAQVLHQDQRIPASRGCAEAYRIDAVVSAGYPQSDDTLVALISVWRQGFEGLERHVIAAPIPPRPDTTTAPTSAPSQPDLNSLITEFLGSAVALDLAELDATLPVRQQADPDALRWPDADLPPLARAIEIFAAQEGFAPHGRIWMTQESVEIIPEGAGGPMRVSLIRLQAFNLGEARRNELMDFLDANAVAPLEAFGAGPHVEWRFVMRPIQGMRADIVAAARHEIAAGDAVDCGPSVCTSPEPLDMDTLGQACTDLPPSQVSGALTGLGQALATQSEDAQATEWLVEHGLWQADGMQIVPVQSGAPQACWWAAQQPD